MALFSACTMALFSAHPAQLVVPPGADGVSELRQRVLSGAPGPRAGGRPPVPTLPHAGVMEILSDPQTMSDVTSPTVPGWAAPADGYHGQQHHQEQSAAGHGCRIEG